MKTRCGSYLAVGNGYDDVHSFYCELDAAHVQFNVNHRATETAEAVSLRGQESFPWSITVMWPVRL